MATEQIEGNTWTRQITADDAEVDLYPAQLTNVVDEAAAERLFVTLIGFDSVYHTHFKCNRRTVLQSQELRPYMAVIHRLAGVPATLDLEHIQHHDDGSHKRINPLGLIPKGADVLSALAALTGKAGQ